MPIQVTCPKCLTRFSVSEKFAGKKGPCPKCKSEITVPDIGDQVIIHAPPDDSPKDSKGRSILKPIERQETRVSRKAIIVTAVAAMLAVLAAVGLRLTGGAPLAAIILGAIVLAPPLVWAGYAFARDQELEPYRGRELMVRVAVLSAILAGLWLVYAWVPTYLDLVDSPAEMSLLTAAIMMAVVLGLGALAAMVVFELEFVGGLTQAGLYFVVTLLLAYLAAVPPFAGAPRPPSDRNLAAPAVNP